MTVAEHSVQLDLLIEPDRLQEMLQRGDGEDLRIVDLCQPQMYSAAHIPGAVHLPVNRLNRGTRPALGELPESDDLHALVQDLGIQPETPVICYDDEGGGWAGRFIWILDVIGHRPKAYLNGGIRAWLSRGYGVESKPALPAPVKRTLKINPNYFVNKEDILDNLGNPDRVIWDARSPEEYRGERLFAKRGGHIPGAVNYEWTRAMDVQNALSIRPLEKIRAELSELGIDAGKEVITHCQTHHRSGFTYLLGRLLGFERIRAYPGSWSEWGNLDDTPIEQS